MIYCFFHFYFFRFLYTIADIAARMLANNPSVVEVTPSIPDFTSAFLRFGDSKL